MKPQVGDKIDFRYTYQGRFGDYNCRPKIVTGTTVIKASKDNLRFEVRGVKLGKYQVHASEILAVYPQANYDLLLLQ